MRKKELTPAIPPDDYKGKINTWTATLQEMKLWDGENPEWYGDVMITDDQWWELLEICE